VQLFELRLQGSSPAVWQSVPQWPLNDEYPFGLAFRKPVATCRITVLALISDTSNRLIPCSLAALFTQTAALRLGRVDVLSLGDIALILRVTSVPLGGMWGALTAVRGFVSLSEGP
jgi:hypothetical protein